MNISHNGAHLLERLFNIRPAEWPRLLLLYLMYLVFIIGSVWAEITLETTFLQQVGVDFLPWFFIVKAFASVFAFAVYTVFADRIANEKLLIAFLVVGVVFILSGLGLLGLGLLILAYPLLYLLIFVPFDELFVSHWYTYTNDFYDTRSAKRIIPVLSTAGRLGSIVAGLTMPLLNRHFSSIGIISIWPGALLIMALLAWLMPYLLKQDKLTGRLAGQVTIHTGSPSTAKRPSYFDNIREGYQYVSQSTFLRWTALTTLVLIVLLTFFQNQTWRILTAEFKTSTDIADFFSEVVWITNLIILPFQLFFLSRIIGRVGVGNANLIFPTGIALIAGGLILWPGIPLAALAHFGRTNFYGAIGYPIDSLLYNAIPLRVKGRTRAFVGGLIVPLGSLLGGLLLLWPLAISYMGVFIAVLAAIFLANAFVIRKQYAQALIKMLEQEDYSFLLSRSATNLSAADPTMLAKLQTKLNESDSYELKIFIAQLISQIGGNEAVSILGQMARAAPDARLRLGIIDILAAADTRAPAIRQLYADFLADADGRVRQSALTGLERLTGVQDKQLLALALTMLSDADVEVQAKALSMLLQSGDSAYRPPATRAINKLLNSPNPQLRARGVYVIRQAGDESFIETLTKYLADPADEVRLEAALTVELLTQTKISVAAVVLLLGAINHLLADPVERIRQIGLIVLGRLDSHESHAALVGALTDPSPHIRATAVEVLVQFKKAAIPVIHPQLDSPDPRLRKMAAIILAQINQRSYGALIETQVTGNLLTIYRNIGRLAALMPVTGYRSMTVLQNALREQNQQFVGEIFYLLKAVQNADAIDTIADSFQSKTAHIRANAAEALESLTNPQIAGLISPLFEPELTPDQLLELSQDAWDMPRPDLPKTFKQLLSYPNTPADLRAITIFVLGEMGSALSPDAGKKEDEAEQKKERGARRLRSADLLGALMAPAEKAASPSSQSAAKPDEPAAVDVPPAVSLTPFTLTEIQRIVEDAFTDPEIEVKLAAQAAKRLLAGFNITDLVKQEETVLSTIEKIIFLKEVPFFQGMTIDQLKVLANVCEEIIFEEDEWIFHQGDEGGVLYVIVNGRVGIEQEKRKGSYARLATLGPRSYFGEMSLFDNSLRSAGAISLQDTLTLGLRREPLIALARQYPDLSLELIHVLSDRLRQANNQVAELTRTRPRELQKLYDQLD